MKRWGFGRWGVVECMWQGASGDCQKSRKRRRITSFTSENSDLVTLISTGKQKKKQANKIFLRLFSTTRSHRLDNSFKLFKNISVTNGGWWSGDEACAPLGVLEPPSLRTRVTAVLPRGDSKEAFDFIRFLTFFPRPAVQSTVLFI